MIPQRSTVIDSDKLKISTYGGDEREARRKIKQLLDKINFAITPELVSSQRAGKATQGTIPDRVPGKAIVHGVTWVIGSNDGGDSNYKIEYGQPVCFDMVSGQYATGLHPDWGPGEYKVIGTALGEVLSGQARIPVMLGKQPIENFALLCKANIDPEGGGSYPSVQTWSEAQTASDQQCLWDFELPKSYKFDEEGQENHVEWEGSGIFVKAFNVTRMYVYKDTLCLLHSSGKPRLQLYCEFAMGSKLLGTLDADLKKDADALMTIDTDFRGGMEGTKVKVFDKMLDNQKKLKKDTKVIVDLFRCATSDDIESFTWRYYVTQANKCQVKDS